ncbi:16S rRNA (guanine(527)-N(7))-methyltransferase RsmG [Candidatus Sumerlaeota bacterium]|nr:16S rRNA (guanine(527)-N(7))-methyltransferase RsmG [Candidatus Sumerlaeota bacterium]
MNPAQGKTRFHPRFRAQGGGKFRPGPPVRNAPPRARAERPPVRIVSIDPETLSPPESTFALLGHWGDRAGGIGKLCARYIALLFEANQIHNLTADAAPEKQWAAHIEDALHAAILMETHLGRPAEGARILDVGSGGGLPGLIWAILWPQARVHLLEATAKKAGVLQKMVARLELTNAEVIADRAELAAHLPKHREQYDWVTARALAPLPVLAEWTTPFAKSGGWVCAIKGNDIDEELKASRRGFRLLGASAAPTVQSYTRADGKACRLLMFHKTEMTPSPYPRRASVTLHSPL